MPAKFVAGIEDIHRRVRGPIHIPRVQRARLVSKRPGSMAQGPDKITYDQFFRYLGLWFIGVMGVSVAVFRKQSATQYNRNGGASAGLNAGVSDELIGQHGN